ncbi:hypothetical protein I6F40_12345 [Pseudoalteromonas sp. SWXJ133]|uniref:hypothetical protein n=1 Tax=Pseudoalteromonas sp. SWXJ133 TaxID=2792069 RepID=UPI0018CF726A|nr:hypothetical protein [Pseudoalteromonas sp. SWXJ133]MBH0021132.1 hypothetical protein [Pseudoalteromonas sp. SWXJ133]
MKIKITQLQLELNISVTECSTKPFEIGMGDTSWRLTEESKIVLKSNKSFSISFNAIDKTITLSEITLNLALTDLETYLICTCIAACDTYFDDLSEIDTEYSSTVEVNEEIIRLHAMYLEEMEGNDFNALYTLMTDEDKYLDMA